MMPDELKSKPEVWLYSVWDQNSKKNSKICVLSCLLLNELLCKYNLYFFIWAPKGFMYVYYWQKFSSTRKLLEKAKLSRASPTSFSFPIDSSLLIVQLSDSIGVSVFRWCNPPITRTSFSILWATTPLRLKLVSSTDVRDLKLEVFPAWWCETGPVLHISGDGPFHILFQVTLISILMNSKTLDLFIDYES